MSEYAGSRSVGQSEGGGAGAASAGRSPGKQTLVEQSAPVQLRAEGAGGEPAPAEGPGDVKQLASRGTRTASSSLPYFDVVQAAFGHHDLSGLVAHTDEEAGETAKGMGAKGYTAGKHVVLGPGADLFTVAHEAEHFIEQQHGLVSLAGGVGAVGDVHEQRADEVAARVVAGQSVEGLLDQYVGHRGGGKGAAADSGPVQHQLFGKEEKQTDIGRKQEEMIPENLARARAFERRLGAAAYNDPRAQDAATEMVKRLLAAVIPGFDANDEAHQKQYEGLFGRSKEGGGDWSSGQVGAEFAVLREALENGNLREKMTGVYNAALGGFKSEVNQLMHADRATIEGRGLDADKLRRRRYQSKPPLSQENYKLKVPFTKKEYSRDLYRTPGDPTDRKKVLSNFEKTGTTRFENEEENQSTDRTVKNLEDEGIGLSEREKAFQFGTTEVDGDTRLRWREGGTRFRTNDENKWVKKYQEKLLMPVTAGPSGTALRLFQAWEFLGKPVAAADFRLALLGWMLTGNDHSFHEIMSTSAPYGLPYKPGLDAYREVAPFSEAELRAIAGAEGFPDEGNYRAQHALAPAQTDKQKREQDKLPGYDGFEGRDPSLGTGESTSIFGQPAHVNKTHQLLHTNQEEATAERNEKREKQGQDPVPVEMDLRGFPPGEIGQVMALLIYSDDRKRVGGNSNFEFINNVMKGNDYWFVMKPFLNKNPQLKAAFDANKFNIKELVLEARQHARYAIEGMKKLEPFTGKVYRGYKALMLPVPHYSWTENKFLSMSTNRELAEGYAKGHGSGVFTILVEMQSVNGRRIGAASMFGAEGEILFAPGTRFKIEGMPERWAGGGARGFKVKWVEVAPGAAGAAPAPSQQPGGEEGQDGAAQGGGPPQGEAAQGGVDDITAI
jgi:Domain of unknown function (DUF4157)